MGKQALPVLAGGLADMSVRALNWAFELDLPPTRKVIMLALADHANHDDRCWPSISRLARISRVDVRTVQRALRAFEAAGLVQARADKRNSDGGQTSNVYTLMIPPDKMSPPPPRHNVTGAVAPVSPQEPPYRSNNEAAARRNASDVAAATDQQRKPKTRRPSGIVCYIEQDHDDRPEAERIEGDANAGEIATAVAVVRTQIVPRTGRHREPTPGPVWDEILRARQEKQRAECAEHAEALRRNAKTKQAEIEADPTARAAREEAARKAMTEVAAALGLRPTVS